MQMGKTLQTPSGVRLREAARHGAGPDWLLLPGGPGLGSESLAGLVGCMPVPGAIWLVDLPGDGSNPGGEDAYDGWPGVLVEAVQALPGAVFVGHSTGGMYLLSVPALESHLRGLVLIGSAPDAGWQAGFARTLAAYPLPQAEAALARFSACPDREHLRAAMLASAPWSFTPAGLQAGRTLLAQLPYCPAAMAWSAEHFDAAYAARWWPRTLPVMILSGAEDRVIDPSVWASPRWQGGHVMRVCIDAAGHFPWVDAPGPVARAFSAFADRLAG